MEDILNMVAYILDGSKTTFALYAITAVFSIPLAVLLALAKSSKYRPLKNVIGLYTWVFRGTPLLLQLFFTYYGLPFLIGRRLGPFTAAAITFIFNYAAYFTEIFRAGIESIDRGQHEAAKVLGMSYWQTMFRIIIPQTIRRVLPPTSNEAINLVKDTALITVLAMPELLRNAKEIVMREFTVTPFMVAAVIYLLITSLIVMLFRRLEQRLMLSD